MIYMKILSHIMTIACFWWGMFTKTWIFQLAQVSCNVIMDFLLPDIPLPVRVEKSKNMQLSYMAQNLHVNH